MAGEIIKGLDLLDIIDYIGRKNKKYLAMLLQDVEDVLDKDSTEFKRVRNLILGNYNNYTRSVLRAIFGTDFENVRKPDG